MLSTQYSSQDRSSSSRSCRSEDRPPAPFDTSRPQPTGFEPTPRSRHRSSHRRRPSHAHDSNSETFLAWPLLPLCSAAGGMLVERINTFVRTPFESALSTRNDRPRHAMRRKFQWLFGTALELERYICRRTGRAFPYAFRERELASSSAFSHRKRRRASIRMTCDSSKTFGWRSRENGKP